MKPCPKCGGKFKRTYSKGYLDEHFPVKSPKDKMNIEIQIESKRLFICIKCKYRRRLNNAQYGAYILSQFKELKI